MLFDAYLRQNDRENTFTQLNDYYSAIVDRGNERLTGRALPFSLSLFVSRSVCRCALAIQFETVSV